jgi:hypothetical protein
MRDQTKGRAASSISRDVPAVAAADNARWTTSSYQARTTSSSGTATPRHSNRTQAPSASEISFLGGMQRPDIGTSENQAFQHSENSPDSRPANSFAPSNPFHSAEDSSLALSSHQTFSIPNPSRQPHFQTWENAATSTQPPFNQTQLFQLDEVDLFYGSDIPFWMGDDQWGGLGGDSWI